MNAAIICLLSLIVFAFGYFVYSAHLARHVFQLRDDEAVPAHTHEDGVDFVPTNKHVLFGHHYASIAGAAPIIGPAVAVVWGWLPALLWVVLGVVFMGAMHDIATLVMSMRHDGLSVGSVSAKVLGPRTRTLFLLVIFALIVIVVAVFAKAIAGLFIKQPGTVIPINFEILVATPGRLVQLLDGGQLQLDDVRMLVFDEADQMVDRGFLPVAKRIAGDCPRKTQIAMFSATLPQSLDSVINALHPQPPLRVRTKGSQHVVPTLKTDNRHVSRSGRFELLLEVLAEDPSVGTLVFANTRRQCKELATWLEDAGIGFASYMGEMDRHERRVNLARFRSGEVSVLVATDLGGRGLDIERVDRVINVHLPKDMDNYLHRVGRTARAGRSGRVVNLVTQQDQPLLAKLKKRSIARG